MPNPLESQKAVTPAGNPHVFPGGRNPVDRTSASLTEGHQAVSSGHHVDPMNVPGPSEMAFRHADMRNGTTNAFPLATMRTDADAFPRDLRGMTNGVPVALSRLDAAAAAGMPGPSGNPAVRPMDHIARLSATPPNGGHGLADVVSHGGPAMKASDAREMMKRHLFPGRAAAGDRIGEGQAEAADSRRPGRGGACRHGLDPALSWTRRTAGLQAAHDQANAALEAAEAALVDPVAQLAMLEEKIGAAEEKCSGLRQQISELAGDDDDDDAPDKLAAARMHLAEWEARVNRLRSKRDFAESGFQPLFEARTHAAEWVKVYKGAKLEVAEAMTDPSARSVSRLTHMRHTGCRVFFPFCCCGTGSRRNGIRPYRSLNSSCGGWDTSSFSTPELAAAQAAQALRDSGMADASQYAEPVPSAQDVLTADAYKIRNESLPPSRIDDYRTPAVPRNVPERDYMDVQRLRDLR